MSARLSERDPGRVPRPPRRARRRRRAHAIPSAAFLLLACSSANEAGPALPVDLGAIYSASCARCHGPDGRGDPELKKAMPLLRDLSDPEVRARSNEEWERVIMAGRNQMPAFGGALSIPKVQALTGYVRRLGKR